jgi:type III restriction enzyme
MKLHFEPNLDYQLQAIEAVCDLFRGQEVQRNEFSVSMNPSSGQHSLGIAQSDLGIGNRLELDTATLLANLRSVQARNALPSSTAIQTRDFTVEMETGTGKTYVYLRTVFELNKRFGFTKFVIVVPSIAIKEGVYKTLQMTDEHFRMLYAGTPCDYFLYDSAKLGQVRNFAISPNIQIMIVTVGAINKKDVNNLYKENEKTNDERPVDLIRATHPIIIVDEPQSVDGGLKGSGKQALAEMNPLCTLRYSATHVDKHHMVYRLDAVDAYERKLVKQIEVAAATVEGAHNTPFVRLLSVNSTRNDITARIEIDVKQASGVERKEMLVHDGADLEDLTHRALYHDYRIGELRSTRGAQSMELRIPGEELYLAPGEAFGDVEPMAVQRQMIRRTIREHLDKELRLRPKGIKVLSLFFIETVDRYRAYDDSGNLVKGPYALAFEEEYGALSRNPAYRALFDGNQRNPQEVHDGYFSIDKKGRWTDTAEGNKSDRDNAERAYNLIMKEKEKLLSFETSLSFIFSHSALREGWDNPNVFQICTLRDIQSEQQRRQTIGRGLRLCVNQDGLRVRDSDVNTLTVVATESYERFAAGLQKEIEAATGIHFGVVEPHQFSALIVKSDDGSESVLGAASSRLIWEHLRFKDYIDVQGRIKDELRIAIRDGTLSLPDFAASHRDAITGMLRKVAGRIVIQDADQRRHVKPRHAVLLSEEFKSLWDRIKYKTTYRVEFDNVRLVNECIRELKNAPPIPRAHLQWRKADISIGSAGVEAIERPGASAVVLAEPNLDLPDVLTELEDRTKLTRRTIQRVLIESGRLDDLRQNPQAFIELAASTMIRCKRSEIVDGVQYRRLGDNEFYAQELLDQEIVGYVRRMIEDSEKKSPYDHIVHESQTEATFAERLELESAVKLFAKLPGWFVVPTPLGPYNPDWAILIEEDGRERLYFVVETKGSTSPDDLRQTEKDKIKCGHAHFKALRVKESPAEYVVARTFDDVISRVMSSRPQQLP